MQDTDKPRKLLSFRRVAALLLLALLAGLWMGGGSVQKQATLDALYDDFTICREAENHPVIARLIATDDTVQAAEEFAADYRNLQGSNVFTAPVYLWQVKQSHSRLTASLGATSAPGETTPAAGVRITAFKDDSSGRRRGLRTGDVILRYDGKPVESPEQLRSRIATAQHFSLTDFSRDETTIAIRRDGDEQQVRVPFGGLGIYCEPED